MVHLKHSAIHWRVRCVLDSSSEEENTAPNVARSSTASRDDNSCGGSNTKTHDDDASTGTATPPWLPPGTLKPGLSKLDTNPPPSSPAGRRCPRRPTTSSPVLLDPPPRSPLQSVPRPASLHTRHERRQSGRSSAAPYARSRAQTDGADRRHDNPVGHISAAPPPGGGGDHRQ